MEVWLLRVQLLTVSLKMLIAVLTPVARDIGLWNFVPVMVKGPKKLAGGSENHQIMQHV